MFMSRVKIFAALIAAASASPALAQEAEPAAAEAEESAVDAAIEFAKTLTGDATAALTSDKAEAEQLEDFHEHLKKTVGPKQAMGRWGVPVDVANVAVFLASDLSAYVSGCLIPVDGGATVITQGNFDADMAEATKAFLEG